MKNKDIIDQIQKKRIITLTRILLGIIILIGVYYASNNSAGDTLRSILKDNPYNYTQGVVIDKHDSHESIDINEHHIVIDLGDNGGKLAASIDETKYDLLDIGSIAYVVLDPKYNTLEEQLIAVFVNKIDINNYIGFEQSKGRPMQELAITKWSDTTNILHP